MRYILLLSLVNFIVATSTFSNIECGQNTDIMPDRIRLTSKRTNVMENSCDWQKNVISFPNTFYIKVDRKYAFKRTNRADSSLSIIINNNFKQKIAIDIHNDKIAVGNEKCMGLFASSKSRPLWIRIDIDALLDLNLTFISVSYAKFLNSIFVECVHVEKKEPWVSGTLTFKGITHSGMTQDVLDFSLSEPFLDTNTKQDNKQLLTRISIIETRLDTLEKQIISNYKKNNLKHKVISERHEDFSRQIQTDKSHVHHKITNRFIVLLFIVILVVILMFWYVKTCIGKVTIIQKDHFI